MISKSIVGLDIGSTRMRAVEIKHGKSGPTLVQFGQVDVPADAIQGGVVHDGAAVTAALRDLWATTRFRSRTVVLGVTNRQVVVREVTLVNMPDRELRASLPFQVREMLPLPPEQSVLDFHPLARVDDGRNVRGLLVAAPKDAVLTAVRTVERAGLHVERVDLASFALLRAASRLDDTVEAIVDIGAQATTVVVHVNGEPLIVRTVPRGGYEITELLAERLGADLSGAEALKRRVGLNDDETEPETAGMIREVIRPLVREVRGSFAYLSAREEHQEVARLVLSGGGSLLQGFDAALQSELDIPVVGADPFARVRIPRRHSGLRDLTSLPAATVSIGLGLRAGR
ncbi:type IV pilus assembly protein PilM [Luedemannella flava]|uniref:Type IV pilus assembly protein PilM n=1 Tax=Luedemannella flava TaxID=349316 RepID=A0ABP4YKN9_9ACTN